MVELAKVAALAQWNEKAPALGQRAFGVNQNVECSFLEHNWFVADITSSGDIYFRIII